METNQDVAQALREAERAEAASYIDYPPTPGWYAPATGLWAAVFCLVISIPSEYLVKAFLLLALIAVEFAFLAWYRRYRGVWPRGRAPQEIRRVMVAFAIGTAVVIGAVGLALLLTTAWIGAIVAFVAVTPAVAWYEHAYANAAARARVRLG